MQDQFALKMFCRANIFVFTFISTSALLIADAQTIVGGYTAVPPSEYENLQIKLHNANLRSALKSTSSCVDVVQIVSAAQQVVAGMNYRIVAIISLNGQSKKYCFLLYQSLPPVTLKVQCAAEQIGDAICDCFKQ